MGELVKMQATEPLRPRDYTAGQLALVKRTVASDCNNDEFDLYIEVCKRVGLDPFRRQIYAVVYNKKNADKRKMSIITGIDGFRAVAARNKDYRPDDEEVEIEYREELKDPATNPLGIYKAKTKAFKLGPDAKWYAVVGVAYWEDFAPLKEVWENNQPTGRFALPRDSKWLTMGRIMIGKCAEAQALRRGWPEDLSGIYAPEEMDRPEIEATATELVEQHQKEERLAIINQGRSVPILWKAGDQVEMVPIGQMADRAFQFIDKASCSVELEAWANTNQAGLRAFWAESKTDALEIKKRLEARIAVLDKPAAVAGE